jgi:NAD(P)-dependent dehydrogenase (short-subunit alcohol dehydrogenase family)
MFKSKVVIVTGSSTGIGAATAVKFAGEGADVVLHGRKEAALQEVKERCLKAGGGKTKVHVVVGDISKEDVRQKLVNETVEKLGKLDVLVNNAGIWDPAQFSESTMELYDKLFEVNVRSLIALTQVAVPHLIKAKGNIVNISSDIGVKAVTWAIFYAVSKAAVDHFSKCLALDLGPKGVRVNCINPGYFPDTDVLIRAGVGSEKKEEFSKQVSDAYPLRRTGKLDEVADAILFVASEKASFITGVLFPVDGGSLAGTAH